MSDFTLLCYLADIRQKSGVGIKPMLSELADAIAAKISTAHAEGMEEAARIADSYEATGDEYDDGQKHSIAAAIRRAKESKT